jgi:hypothetical protein
MSFGYKTSWLAVRDQTVEEVADALDLRKRVELGFAEGTERAYTSGVYVAAPISGWTLAHGRDLPLDAGQPDFAEELCALSERLGEVQFFGTHRVVDYHAWAWARSGELVRGYCYVGESGDVPLFQGEPTPAEVTLGKGTQPLDDAFDGWSDDEIDTWFATTPDEGDVMAIAGAWSLDPTQIDDSSVTAAGIWGR